MLTDDLAQIGMNAEEVKVYLAILELGGGFVSTIAKHANVHRVTCYNTLGNLVKKNLINYSSQKRARFYTAEPPQILLNQIEEKFSTTKKILPELLALQRSSAFTPKIRYYEEKTNMLTIFDDMAQAKTEILGYTNLVPLSELFPEAMEKFGKIIIQKKINVRLLAPFNKQNENCIQKFFKDAITKNFIEILCVNPKQFPFMNGVFFYDDKMVIISYTKHELLGVIIESAVNTQTQRAMFDLAWLGATSYIVR